MNARRKLNAAYAAGSLLFASLIGSVTGSIAIFVVALVALLGLDFVAGNIRTRARQ